MHVYTNARTHARTWKHVEARDFKGRRGSTAEMERRGEGDGDEEGGREGKRRGR